MKETEKPSPTPWRIYKEPMNPNPRIMAEASTLVAVISEGRAFARPTDANAAFIVRAVNAHGELIEAMRTAARLIGDDWTRCDDETGEECKGKDCDDPTHQAVSILDEAIAKAEAI